MTPEEIRKQHPAAYAAIVAIGEAEARDNSAAHVVAARASGDVEFALQAIADGTAFDSCQSHYLSAARARREQSLAALDSEVALDAIAGATPPTTTAGGGLADQIADRVASRVQQRNPKPGEKRVATWNANGDLVYEEVTP